MKWYCADICYPDNDGPLLFARSVEKPVWDLGFYDKSTNAYYTIPERAIIKPLLWTYAPMPKDGDELIGVNKKCPPIYRHQYQAILHRIGSESIKKPLTEWMDDDTITSEYVQAEIHRIADENPMSTIEYVERYIIDKEEQGYVHERHHH